MFEYFNNRNKRNSTVLFESYASSSKKLPENVSGEKVKFTNYKCS